MYISVFINIYFPLFVAIAFQFFAAIYFFFRSYRFFVVLRGINSISCCYIPGFKNALALAQGGGAVPVVLGSGFRTAVSKEARKQARKEGRKEGRKQGSS